MKKPGQQPERLSADAQTCGRHHGHRRGIILERSICGETQCRLFSQTNPAGAKLVRIPAAALPRQKKPFPAPCATNGCFSNLQQKENAVVFESKMHSALHLSDPKTRLLSANVALLKL